MSRESLLNRLSIKQNSNDLYSSCSIIGTSADEIEFIGRADELGGAFTDALEIANAEPSNSLVLQTKAILKYEESVIKSTDSVFGRTPRARRLETARSKRATEALETKSREDYRPSISKSLTNLRRELSIGTLDSSLSPRFSRSKTGRIPTTSSVKRIISNSQHLYINKYLVKEEIGRGTFGNVRKCKDITTGKTYAMKILNKLNLQNKLKFRLIDNNTIARSSAWDDVEKEIAIMKKLQHPNVVQLVDVINSADVLYLIMEWMPDGSIAKGGARISKLEREDPEHKYQDREVLRLYVRDMVSGLSYLHSQRICHCDIKPENILIGRDGVLKLADFGLSKILLEGESRDIFKDKEGTTAFQAPECLSASDRKFCMFPTDVWALGVTIYQLKYGILPFWNDDEEILVHNIVHEELKIPDYEDKDLADIIRDMLKKDPSERVTTQQLCVHPWMTDRGKWPKLIHTYPLTTITASDYLKAVGQYANLDSPDEMRYSLGKDPRNTANSAALSFPEKELCTANDSKVRLRNQQTGLIPKAARFVLPDLLDDEGDAIQKPQKFQPLSSALIENTSTSRSSK